MLIQELLSRLPGSRAEGPLDTEILDVSCDSRRVAPGTLFAAVPGERHDGHDFLETALSAGACAVISERPAPCPSPCLWITVPDVRRAMSLAAFAVHGSPDRSMPFLGVTGTSGKTTITYILEAMLAAAGRKPAVVGTVEYRFGGEATPASRTTPESPDLARFAADCRNRGGDALVMEVSSHALSLARVYGVAFEAALFTNLNQDHLDFYGDLDTYFDAKRMLFDGRNGPLPRHAILNLDDPRGAELYAAFPGSRAGTGTAPEADLRILDHAFLPSGLEATLSWRGRKIRLRSPLTGTGNLQNLVQCLACALLMGLPEDRVLEAMATLPPIPGRLEEVLPGGAVRVFVDYAHKEGALANACSILRHIAPGRLIVVFGCGGDKDRSKRPLMGKVVARMADVMVVTSDNPRSEDPEAILDEIVPGIQEIRQDFIRQADRHQAIAQAVELAAPGDVILIAGKGHETYQILKDRTIHFDDREEAADCLRRTGKGGA